jgi:serine phosphatase RsbU (regulator of sigma subunit)
MLTAKDKIQDIITAFQSGANDYIRKPFNSYELIARINTHLSLKKAIVEKQKLANIEEDIEIAKSIQANTLSSSIPESDLFTITVRYVPMKGIGGDFYGFHEIDKEHLGVLIADVSGHGIHAALIASMLKVIFSTLRPFAAHPVTFLTEMNTIIMRNTEYSYLTALYAVIDIEKMTLFYSRAGHEPVLVYRKETDEIIYKKIHGRIIGFSDAVNFELGEIKLQKGDRIILFTDGVEETFNKQYEMYGQERFNTLIKESRDLNGSEFADTLTQSLSEWSGNTENYHDDITLICIDV